MLKNLKTFLSENLLSWIRAWPLAAIAIVLTVVVLLADIARLDNLIYGALKVSLLAYVGYWIDRWLFPYARPHDWWWDSAPADDAEALTGYGGEPLTSEELQAIDCNAVITPIPQIRRAIIVAACILTATLIP